MREQVDGLIDRLRRPENSVQGVPFSDTELARRLIDYHTATRPVAELLATGAYWGEDDQSPIWVAAIEDVANAVEPGNGLVVWIQLRLLPATMLLYAAGVAALAKQDYAILRAVLSQPELREVGEAKPASQGLLPNAILDASVAARIPDLARHHTPGSDHVHAALRETLKSTLHLGGRYDRLFNAMEYYLGLAYLDESGDELRSWAPVGRFAWHGRNRAHEDPMRTIPAELEQAGSAWPPLHAGWFGGELSRAKAAVDVYQGIAEIARQHYFF